MILENDIVYIVIIFNSHFEKISEKSQIQIWPFFEKVGYFWQNILLFAQYTHQCYIKGFFYIFGERVLFTEKFFDFLTDSIKEAKIKTKTRFSSSVWIFFVLESIEQ